MEALFLPLRPSRGLPPRSSSLAMTRLIRPRLAREFPLRKKKILKRLSLMNPSTSTRSMSPSPMRLPSHARTTSTRYALCSNGALREPDVRLCQPSCRFPGSLHPPCSSSGGKRPSFRRPPCFSGRRVVVFATSFEREYAIDCGPYLGREHSVHLTRHEDTDNRFLFTQEELVAISIEDFSMEHWSPPHIIHSTAAFANSYHINPICLSGMDYSAVLVTVKACRLSDIPHALAIPGAPFGGSGGRGGNVFLGGFNPNSSPPPPSLAPNNGVGPNRVIEMPGGGAMWGTHAPVVRAVPILAKPSNAEVKLFPGFFEVHVSGPRGAKGFYKIPTAPRGSGPLMVSNFASCSTGHLAQVASVGHAFLPVLSVDVFYRDPRAVFVPPSSAVLEGMVVPRLDRPGPDDYDKVKVEGAALQLSSGPPAPEKALAGQAKVVVAPSPMQRSLRLDLIEESTFVFVLERASRRKRSKLEGLSGLSCIGLLPSKELLELAKEVLGTLGADYVGYSLAPVRPSFRGCLPVARCWLLEAHARSTPPPPCFISFVCCGWSPSHPFVPLSWLSV
uniref:Uncharacterized protein n=1 Tax=Avena sativa TaxID=4498 RepID=A0ACD5YQG7_AVESA